MTGSGQLSEAMAELAADVLAGGGVTESDVTRLRREVFKDGVVDRDEAELMFHLDAHGENNDQAWKSFFVEALTNYFVWKQHPPGVLSDDDGRFLVERVTHDGKIDGETEFKLIVDVISKAQSCPEDVVVLALGAVKEIVLEGSGVKFGAQRSRPGVIDAADVEIIKKVVYGAGGGGGFTITRREAELLFELNNATVDKENTPTWRELFVNAVGNYLMFPRGAPKVVGAEEIRRREAIPEKSSSRISYFGKAFSAWKDERASETEDLQNKLEAADEADTREKLDESEAAWLIERITEDDVVHDNEKALLAHIKRLASEIHPSLLPFMEKYGV